MYLKFYIIIKYAIKLPLISWWPLLSSSIFSSPDPHLSLSSSTFAFVESTLESRLDMSPKRTIVSIVFCKFHVWKNEFSMFFERIHIGNASQGYFTFCLLMSLVNYTCDVFNLLNQTNLLTALVQYRWGIFSLVGMCHRYQFWSSKRQTSCCMVPVRIDYCIKWAHICVWGSLTSLTSRTSMAFA